MAPASPRRAATDALIPPALDRAAFWLFAALVVWAPLPLGSNRPWAWALLEIGIFIAGLLWLGGWLRRESVPGAAARAAWPAFVLFGLWLLLLIVQCLPLPAALVRLVSPQAAEVHAAADIIRQGRAWTLSLDPHATMVFWLKSCAYVVAFALTLLLVQSRTRLAWLCIAIVASGAVQAYYGSVMHLSKAEMEVLGMQMQHAAQASGAYVNRNHLAGLLEMSLAIGIGLMIAQLDDRPGRGSWKDKLRNLATLLLSQKAMLRLTLVIMVIALVMTRSRMGNTAFFASLLVAGIMGLALSRHAPRSTVILLVSLIVIDVLIVGAWFGVDRTIQRIQETTIGNVEERIDPSVYATQIFKDYPLVGTGGGTFYTAYTRYRGKDILDFYDHVHNDYVQFFSETGAIGIGLLGLLVIGSLICAVLAQARRHDPLARGAAFGAFMGIVAIGIHSTVDFNLQIPANAFIFVILLALCWVSLYLGKEPPTRRQAGS